MRRSAEFHTWYALLCVLALGMAAPAGAALPEDGPRKVTRVTGKYEASVYASGLKSPDGVAMHPVTRELYVTEAEAGRISVIRNGKPVIVISQGWEISDDLPKWAITPDKPLKYWLLDQLRSPESIAFSPEGHLYVTEDIGDGRLLEFMPDANGIFRSARAIPIPWFYKDFAWDSVTVSSDGRLFLAGSAAEAGPSLFFGVVLMRDIDGDWWVVDYGPFAGFASVNLSRNEDILIVGEEVNGSVTWWDTLRHRAIGTVQQTFPNLENASALPDGALIVAQQVANGEPDSTVPSEHKNKHGRLIRVNPQTGNVTELARGLGMVEDIHVSQTDGTVFVTEKDTGLILELRPLDQVASRDYLLENTVRLSEIAQGLPPKKWPPFLKGFFKDLGVNPRDEVVRHGEQGHEDPSAPNTYTLVEVGKAIPLIAGKVKTHDQQHEPGVDPIEEIDFIVLFPNRSFSGGEEASPGLAFFSARMESGAVERTYSLENLKAIKFSSRSGWTPFSDRASIFLPSAACSVRPTEEGMDISLAFISLKGGDDYYLQLKCGKENTGTLMVDSRQGLRSNYGIDFTEETLDGAAYNSIVVAGFSETENETAGWLNIGNWPMGYSISAEENLPWTPYSANGGQPVLEQLWGLQKASLENSE